MAVKSPGHAFERDIGTPAPSSLGIPGLHEVTSLL